MYYVQCTMYYVLCTMQLCISGAAGKAKMRFFLEFTASVWFLQCWLCQTAKSPSLHNRKGLSGHMTEQCQTEINRTMRIKNGRDLVSFSFTLWVVRGNYAKLFKLLTCRITWPAVLYSLVEWLLAMLCRLLQILICFQFPFKDGANIWRRGIRPEKRGSG